MAGLRLQLREYIGAIDAFDEAIAHRLAMSRTDLRCFDLLERRGTMTAGRLAEASGLSTGAVTFLLDRMEAAGFVRRRRDATDRRRVLVEIVPEAGRRAHGLHEPMINDMRALAQSYSIEQLAVVRDFLRDARRVYEAHAPPLRAGNPVSLRQAAGTRRDGFERAERAAPVNRASGVGRPGVAWAQPHRRAARQDRRC